MNNNTIKIPADWIIPNRVSHTRNERGIALADLQLVCGAGPYELDLLVREQLSAPSLQIVGQVTLGNRIYEPVADLPLVLVKANKAVTVTDTRTDDFGEFDMESDRNSAYGLRLGADEDAPCVLVWEGAAEG